MPSAATAQPAPSAGPEGKRWAPGRLPEDALSWSGDVCSSKHRSLCDSRCEAHRHGPAHSRHPGWFLRRTVGTRVHSSAPIPTTGRGRGAYEKSSQLTAGSGSPSTRRYSVSDRDRLAEAAGCRLTAWCPRGCLRVLASSPNTPPLGPCGERGWELGEGPVGGLLVRHWGTQGRD